MENVQLAACIIAVATLILIGFALIPSGSPTLQQRQERARKLREQDKQIYKPPFHPMYWQIDQVM